MILNLISKKMFDSRNKYTEEKLRKIREMFLEGRTQAEIAGELGLSPQLVNHYVKRKTVMNEAGEMVRWITETEIAANKEINKKTLV